MPTKMLTKMPKMPNKTPPGRTELCRISFFGFLRFFAFFRESGIFHTFSSV